MVVTGLITVVMFAELAIVRFSMFLSVLPNYHCILLSFPIPHKVAMQNEETLPFAMRAENQFYLGPNKGKRFFRRVELQDGQSPYS